MAEIQLNTANKTKKRRAKILAPRLDMTPMVDLAFLLLTFFVLTATFGKPKSMVLTFPRTNGDPSITKNGITFLLGKDNRIFYYEGQLRPEASDDRPKTQLQELSFAQTDQRSLHTFLLAKNKHLHTKIRSLTERHNKGLLSDARFKQLIREAKADKSEFTYLIKTDADATYENVIDLIDELNINVVGKYVITDLMKQEQDLMNEWIASK